MRISFAQTISALWYICIARVRADLIDQGDSPYLSSAEVYDTFILQLWEGDNPYLSLADVYG